MADCALVIMPNEAVRLTRDGGIAVARLGELWLAATGDVPVSDATWREYLEFAKESVAVDGPFTGLYLYFPKHGPTAAQRNMLTTEYGSAVRLDMQRRVAVLSDSALTRGAMTAISWFTSGLTLRAFAPAARDRQQALEWLATDIAFDLNRAATLEVRLTRSPRSRMAG